MDRLSVRPDYRNAHIFETVGQVMARMSIEYMREYRARNRAKIRARHTEWRSHNPQKLKQYRLKEKPKRQAREKGRVRVTASKSNLNPLLRKFMRHCIVHFPRTHQPRAFELSPIH